MYIESVSPESQFPSYLLRESYQGKVKKWTLANPSSWPAEMVEKISYCRGEAVQPHNQEAAF